MSQDKVLTLTTEAFQASVLDDPTPILIDFWAPWCGPCRMMSPILHKAAESLDGVCRVAKVNVDEEGDLAQAFGIRSIPTLVLMQDGKPIDAVSGVLPEATLVARVRGKISPPQAKAG